MASNATIDQDSALAQVVTLAVATFAVVTLTGAAARRMATSIAANLGTNKQIKDEAGVLLAVTTASGALAVIMTEAGLQRNELERSGAPGY